MVGADQSADRRPLSFTGAGLCAGLGALLIVLAWPDRNLSATALGAALVASGILVAAVVAFGAPATRGALLFAAAVVAIAMFPSALGAAPYFGEGASLFLLIEIATIACLIVAARGSGGGRVARG